MNNNVTELENQAKFNATKLMVESFQRGEHFDKIPQLKKRYKSEESATEAQLKLAIQSQLDGVKDGLEKLDSSYIECCKIRERMDEISNELINIKRLSDGLESLQEQCKHQKQLAAAMDNMDYLVKVPEMIRQAEKLIDSENYLHAHKIIEELEGTRDEIMWELFKQSSSESDLKIIATYFSDVDKLNKKILQHVHFMGERFINAIISQNVVLVNCIRIIDREERADVEYSNKDYTPPGRPKALRAEFFSKVQLYIKQKIFESALDEDGERNFLRRHLDAIRLQTIRDLKLIKNIGVIYFPPRYRVFDEFVIMYHEEICNYVMNKSDAILDEDESCHLLSWINHYHFDEFMGSPELGINFNKIEVRHVNLLTTEQFDKLAHQYLERLRMKLQQWLANCIITDVKDWESEESPQCDNTLKYTTSLWANVVQPLREMTGEGKVLAYLGEKIREKYFPLYLEEIAAFQAMYKKELKEFRERYRKTVIPMSLEYLIANANNCIKLKSALEELIKKDLDNSPSIQVKIDDRMQQIGKEMLNIAQLCLDFIKDMLHVDLYRVLSKVMTTDWAFGSDNVSDYILGTVADYNGTLIYLKDAAYRRLITAIVEQIIVEYVKNILTKRLTLNVETRKQVSNKIFNEGDKLLEYFSKEMSLDKKITYCVKVLPLISQLLSNSDTSMIRLEINALVKCFPSIRKDQMINLIMLRGDISLNDAREIADDYTYCSIDDETKLFMKVAAAMNQS